MRSLLLPALLLASGCKSVEPAPDDLDSLLHLYWDAFATGDDDSLDAAIVNLDAAIDVGALPLRGAQTRLVDAQLATVGLQGSVDPGLANGFFVVTALDCSVDELEAVFIALDQDAQYPGNYDAYARTYTSDADAYLARTAPQLTWDVEISASPAGFEYVEHLSGGIRRVPDLGAGLGEHVIARTWLREPAIEDDENRSFDQDYQLDLYWQRAPGQLVHAYAIWRQIDMGVLGDQDSDLLVNFTLGEAEKWDRKTEALCAAGR